MTSLRQITLSNGSLLHINPDHVMFVAQAQKEGTPIVNQCVVKMIDGSLLVDGTPADVAMLLGGEG